MKFTQIHHCTVLGVEVFFAKEGYAFPRDAFPREPFSPEKWARQLIEILEDQACIAFLEALSIEAQKAINRHAEWCGQHGDGSFWEKPPEWATKYREVGV